MQRSSNTGLTLLELIISMSILTIIAFYSTMTFSDFLDKQRLKHAGETLFSDLRFAQSEAIKRNQKVFVTFKQKEEKWCYGTQVGSSCDCFTKNQCQIDGFDKVVNSEQFKNIHLQRARFAGNKDYTAFDPIKGFALAGGVKNGTIWLQSSKGTQIAVIVNRMGRVRFCSPTLLEYPNKCPKNPNK